MRTKGKTAVVTGGASGIGAALAEAIVSDGGRVVVADINSDAAEAHAAKLGDAARAIPCNVADVAGVEAMATEAWDWLGGVDLVFANAGISVARPLLKASEAEFDVTLDVNLKGVWATAKAFATRMMDAGRDGHLCLTASEHALGLQHPGNGFYTASKHGVLALGDVFRAELPDGIGVSVLCPGLTATHMPDTSPAATGMSADERRSDMARAVMAEGKPPSEVARHTLDEIARGTFLIVPEASAWLAAEKRADEVKDEFTRQAPMGPDAMKYHVGTVVERLMKKPGPGLL
jgi:NAD(P)-dependent dehydrogenase (short-subunit alcohol dehydrogenase family)